MDYSVKAITCRNFVNVKETVSQCYKATEAGLEVTVMNSCTLCRLDPLICSDSELTSETMNPCKQFGRTPWVGDQTIGKSLPTQDSTTRK